ncbi:hypothetical protein C8P65_10254 [Capnocytophaga leadbetteri]|uniref:Uncharacterized protein n=1 Tax=Capnocytophaga leadbetteri TaxID=327575 RepID=A0A2T5XX27_9FLAO|nr:hypothetical protein C8P65_10254 [Capnocytophaga leadbetteri]
MLTVTSPPLKGAGGDVNNQSYKNLNYINKPF